MTTTAFGCLADAPPDAVGLDAGSDAVLDAMRALIEEYDRASGEIARLALPDDLGAGERTARLSMLGAWEFRRSRIIEQIAALTGDGGVEVARARARR